MVAGALSRMTMGNVSHIDKSKKDLVKDIHRLARLGVRLEDSSNGGFMVHHNSELSFVVVVKFEQHHDKSFMKCKESFFGKLNEAFSLRGLGFEVPRKIMCYHGI